jgi:hypothetical protein
MPPLFGIGSFGGTGPKIVALKGGPPPTVPKGWGIPPKPPWDTPAPPPPPLLMPRAMTDALKHIVFDGHSFFTSILYVGFL